MLVKIQIESSKSTLHRITVIKLTKLYSLYTFKDQKQENLCHTSVLIVSWWPNGPFRRTRGWSSCESIHYGVAQSLPERHVLHITVGLPKIEICYFHSKPIDKNSVLMLIIRKPKAALFAILRNFGYLLIENYDHMSYKTQKKLQTHIKIYSFFHNLENLSLSLWSHQPSTVM